MAHFPAPTAYEPEKHTLDHKPAYTFGTKSETRTIVDAPGRATQPILRHFLFLGRLRFFGSSL